MTAFTTAQSVGIGAVFLCIVVPFAVGPWLRRRNEPPIFDGSTQRSQQPLDSIGELPTRELFRRPEDDEWVAFMDSIEGES